MGHGTPVSEGEGFGETPGPFMLDVGISSTRRIAGFWGIDDVQPSRGDAPLPSQEIPQLSHRVLQAKPPNRQRSSAGVQTTIEDALRAAGLMN
jgi:hypothetical protein